MVFSKEDKILIKKKQLKSYTATRFLNSEPKNWTRAQMLITLRNELLHKLIILLHKPYFGLLCANYVV